MTHKHSSSIYKIISDLQISFIDSNAKGLLFWKATLLPESRENLEINDNIYQSLMQSFGSSTQIKTVVDNLKTLRAECLKDKEIKQMVEDIYNKTLNIVAAQILIEQPQPLQDENNP